MKKSTSLLLPIIIACVFSLSLLVKSTYAADPPPINITVNPPSLEYVATATGTIQDRFRLQNNSTSPSNLNIRVVKISVNDAGEVAPANPSADDDWISWLKLDSTKLVASPNEWVDVPFTINIPAGAGLGYYYGLEIGPDEPTAVVEGAKVSGKVLLPILLTVKKDGAVSEAEITKFESSKNIYEYPPVNFTTQVKNTGNVALKPRGNIFITDGSGKQIGLVEVNPGMSTVLPQQIRTFDAMWNDSFIVLKTEVIDGQEKTSMHFNWNKLTDFRFGKFNAHLVMVYDNGQRDVPMDSTISFWIIPYTPILITIGIIIALIFLVKFGINSYVKGQVKKQSK